MRAEDVGDLQRLSAISYEGAAQPHLSPAVVATHTRKPAHAALWEMRTHHLLNTDPAGCWVAEAADEMIGFAVSFNRELMWILSSYAVLPQHQGQGVGEQLLQAALRHGQGCLRGMLVSSADPRAARRYRGAGFSLHPQMALTGILDRSAIPVLDRVRDGGLTDIELMDSVDRRIRGAAHGPDHQFLISTMPLLIIDRSTGSGYVYLEAAGTPALLAATNRRTASELLWAALATTPATSTAHINHVTAANEWAIDVGMAARLMLSQGGYLGVRHLKPPMPYLPHRALL